MPAHTQSRVTIGYSLGALQQLAGRLDSNPKVLAILGSTPADREYLRTGLGHAIRQLQFFRENQAAIEAALNAVAAARPESAAS